MKAHTIAYYDRLELMYGRREFATYLERLRAQAAGLDAAEGAEECAEECEMMALWWPPLPPRAVKRDGR